MIPVQFDYVAPTELGQAVAVLQGNPNAAPLAGGVSLIPAMTTRRSAPALLVDLGMIADLRGISASGDGLRVGATTTYAEIAASADVRQKYAALAEAVGSTADPQARNRGTIGGALAFADPADDVTAAALALDATVQVIGPQGRRSLSIADFVVGPYRTALMAGEIITAVVFPANDLVSTYVKFSNPGSGYAICGVAAALGRSGDGRVSVCRVAVTGAADRPVRLSRVEDALRGKALTAGTVAEAAKLAADPGLTFRSDLAATAEYRAHLTGVLVKRVLSSLLS